MSNTLTVVIPTQGRFTLSRCLESMSSAKQGSARKDVTVIVAADTHSPLNGDVQGMAKHFDCEYIELDAGTHNWGYPQLQYGYEIATTNYIANIGDDDIYMNGAFEKLLDIVNGDTVQPYLVQAILHPSPNRGNKTPVVLWNEDDKYLLRSKVTGQNFICPNVKGKIGFWWDDFCQMESTIYMWGGKVTWVPEIVASCF